MGSRHPEKIAGLIYLDAGYSYAFYDRSRGDLMIDLLELQQRLEKLLPGKEPQDQKSLLQDLLTGLPQFEQDLQQRQEWLKLVSAPSTDPMPIIDQGDRAKASTST